MASQTQQMSPESTLSNMFQLQFLSVSLLVVGISAVSLANDDDGADGIDLFHRSSIAGEILAPIQVEHKLQAYARYLQNTDDTAQNLQEVNDLLALSRSNLADCDRNSILRNEQIFDRYSDRASLKQFALHHNKRLHMICVKAIEDSIQIVGQRFEGYAGKLLNLNRQIHKREPSDYYWGASTGLLHEAMAKYLLSSPEFKRLLDSSKNKPITVSKIFEDEFGIPCRNLRDEINELESLYGELNLAMRHVQEQEIEKDFRLSTKVWRGNAKLCYDIFAKNIDFGRIYDTFKSIQPGNPLARLFNRNKHSYQKI